MGFNHLHGAEALGSEKTVALKTLSPRVSNISAVAAELRAGPGAPGRGCGGGRTCGAQVRVPLSTKRSCDVLSAQCVAGFRGRAKTGKAVRAQASEAMSRRVCCVPTLRKSHGRVLDRGWGERASWPFDLRPSYAEGVGADQD